MRTTCLSVGASTGKSWSIDFGEPGKFTISERPAMPDTVAVPLPATEALVGYLYYVALRYGAVARLGYSFWAEGVYGHIAAPFIKMTGISSELNIAPIWSTDACAS